AARQKDTFYTKVIECRELSKAKSTYVDGFRPHADGRVHTTFTFATAIGQTSCCASWTPVRTQRGDIPIKDVQVGDLVWTHQQRWRPVTATWIHAPDEMVEVQFSNGIVLTCTTNHRLLVFEHECIKGLVDPREHRSSFRSVSIGDCPNIGEDSQEARGFSEHYQL